MGANWESVISDACVWVLDHPMLAVSIVAAVVLSVFFALPGPPFPTSPRGGQSF